MISKDEIEAYNSQYQQLKGAQILSFTMAQCEYDPEQYWPTFIMKKGSDLFKFVLSQDPEGNGGGFAFIEDL